MAVGRYHWSNAAYSARFFVIDAFACVPMLAVIMHPSWTGLYLLLGTIAFLFYVERIKKMSIRAFFRSINLVFTGRVKSSLNIFKELSR